jgi:hypothetical protein
MHANHHGTLPVMVFWWMKDLEELPFFSLLFHDTTFVFLKCGIV